MKNASDFRSIARDALRGRWGIAVIAGLIAVLLGAAASGGPEINIEYSSGNVQFLFANQQIYSTSGGWLPELNAIVIGGAVYLFIAAIVMAAVLFVLGSVISLGYARFHMDLLDRSKEPEIGTLFGYFSHWKGAAMARLLSTVYVFLWSLLFVIPGIMVSYSYAMTSYILAEHPEMEASEALTKSKEMMYGNRWRLFCLDFSFIGWSFLSALTLGIGNLWLLPYKQTATAAFYRDLSGGEHTSYTSGPDRYAPYEPWER